MLVGVDEKRDEKAVAADVEKCDALTQIGFAPENVVVLTNEKADAQAIRQTLDVAFRSTVPGDALFLFFLGRCELTEVEGKTRSFFLTFGADSKNLEATALDVDELIAKTWEDDASRKTLIFDAGLRKPLQETVLTGTDAESSTANGGFVCVASPFEETRRNVASAESVFTRLLTETTNELAKENDGATAKEVVERLAAKIEENGGDRMRTALQWRLTADFPMIAPKERVRTIERKFFGILYLLPLLML